MDITVVAILWSDPPGAYPSEIIVAVPAQVSHDFPSGSYISINAYSLAEDDEEEIVGDPVQVALFRCPAEQLAILAESTPRTAEVVTFAPLLQGFQPDPAEAFAAMMQSSFPGSSFQECVALHLGGGERASECCLCVSCAGGSLDEVFASAAELEPSAACSALVRVPPTGRRSSAPGTPVGALIGGGQPSRGQALRGLSPMPTARA
eukprot:6461624-Amphidinium_carterae.1